MGGGGEGGGGNDSYKSWAAIGLYRLAFSPLHPAIPAGSGPSFASASSPALSPAFSPAFSPASSCRGCRRPSPVARAGVAMVTPGGIFIQPLATPPIYNINRIPSSPFSLLFVSFFGFSASKSIQVSVIIFSVFSPFFLRGGGEGKMMLTG